MYENWVLQTPGALLASYTNTETHTYTASTICHHHWQITVSYPKTTTHTHTFTHTYLTNSKGRDIFFAGEHVWCKIKRVRSAWSVTGGFSIFVCTCLRKTKRKKESVKDKWKDFFFFYPHINFCQSNIIKTLSAEQNALRLCIYSLRVYGIIKPQQQGLYSSEDDSSCLQFIQMTATVCFSNSGGRSDLLNWLLRGGVTSSSH